MPTHNLRRTFIACETWRYLSKLAPTPHFAASGYWRSGDEQGLVNVHYLLRQELMDV